MRNLSGFGCRLAAYDPYENEEAAGFGAYCSLEELFQKSDIITFHTPATESSFHMARVNRYVRSDFFAQVEKGEVLAE